MDDLKIRSHQRQCSPVRFKYYFFQAVVSSSCFFKLYDSQSTIFGDLMSPIIECNCPSFILPNYKKLSFDRVERVVATWPSAALFSKTNQVILRDLGSGDQLTVGWGVAWFIFVSGWKIACSWPYLLEVPCRKLYFYVNGGNMCYCPCPSAYALAFAANRHAITLRGVELEKATVSWDEIGISISSHQPGKAYTTLSSITMFGSYCPSSFELWLYHIRFEY